MMRQNFSKLIAKCNLFNLRWWCHLSSAENGPLGLLGLRPKRRSPSSNAADGEVATCRPVAGSCSSPAETGGNSNFSRQWFSPKLPLIMLCSAERLGRYRLFMRVGLVLLGIFPTFFNGLLCINTLRSTSLSLSPISGLCLTTNHCNPIALKNVWPGAGVRCPLLWIQQGQTDPEVWHLDWIFFFLARV